MFIFVVRSNDIFDYLQETAFFYTHTLSSSSIIAQFSGESNKEASRRTKKTHFRFFSQAVPCERDVQESELRYGREETAVTTLVARSFDRFETDKNSFQLLRLSREAS